MINVLEPVNNGHTMDLYPLCTLLVTLETQVDYSCKSYRELRT